MKLPQIVQQGNKRSHLPVSVLWYLWHLGTLRFGVKLVTLHRYLQQEILKLLRDAVLGEKFVDAAHGQDTK